MSRRKRQRVLNKLNYRNIPLVDYALGATVLGLTLFGILMVYDTSVIVAFERFGDRLWFLKNQAMWAFIGIGVGFIVSGIDYKFWRKLANPMLAVSLVMLILVFVPGFSSDEYTLNQRLVFPSGLPFLEYLFIQPSEVVKLTLVIYLAHLFDSAKATATGRIKNKFNLPHWQFLVVTGLVVVLVAIEPDQGNALLIAASAFVVYFTAGAPLLFTIGLGGVGILAALAYALSSDYRRERLLTFLNPLADPQGASYQITQILLALGSGGLLGLGLGNSRQKYQYIPEVTTDSIFAVIGEELGLIGASLVIAALFFVIWRGFKIAAQTQDEFGRLLAIGLSANIGLQAIVNLGGMVGLLPLTGVPLPFVSYGGSSLTLLLVSIGILLSISRSVES